MAFADDIDAQLHAERVDGKRKRVHALAWRDIPAGAYVDLAGVPHVVLHDSLRPWSADNGYGAEFSRPKNGAANVLTPPLSLRAIANGYVVQIAQV